LIAVADLENIEQILLTMDYDDGFVAYLNGVEAARVNMPDGEMLYNTPASGSHEASGAQIFDVTHLKASLSSTMNVLAIEVHNTQIGSSDLSCVPQLTLWSSVTPCGFTLCRMGNRLADPHSEEDS